MMVQTGIMKTGLMDRHLMMLQLIVYVPRFSGSG
jgi:hypothetical protein